MSLQIMRKGDHLKVPVVFYHSATVPGHQKRQKMKSQRAACKWSTKSCLEHKVKGLRLVEGDIALL